MQQPRSGSSEIGWRAHVPSAQRGDRDARASLYRVFAPAVHAIALAHVGAKDADDVTHDETKPDAGPTAGPLAGIEGAEAVLPCASLDDTLHLGLFSFTELGITTRMPYINFEGDTVLFGDAGATNKLYLWNDGDLTLAIQSGDTLDGKVVDELLVVRRALADDSFAFPVRFTDGSVAIYVAEFSPAVANVTMDVPGTLHPHHDGSPSAVAGLNDVIDVVVFGSSIANGDAEDFVANQINPASLRFGPAEASVNPGSTPVFDVDVNTDGDNDAQFEFLTGDAGLACASAEATLTGETNSGEMFQGTGSVSTNCDALCHN